MEVRRDVGVSLCTGRLEFRPMAEFRRELVCEIKSESAVVGRDRGVRNRREVDGSSSIVDDNSLPSSVPVAELESVLIKVLPPRMDLGLDI